MNRMAGCVNPHIWSEQHVVSNGDLSHIQHNAVGVGVKILSDFNMISVFTVERRLKIYVFLMFDSCTLQAFHAFFWFKGHCRIVFPDSFFGYILLCCNRLIGNVCHFVVSSVNIVHSIVPPT